MQGTLFGIVKFRTPQALSSWSNLLVITSKFQHYKPDGRGDVNNIIVHQNVRLSEVISTNILDSDHLPIMFSILDPVRKREVEKLTDMELF
jgi:hypothetical protein